MSSDRSTQIHVHPTTATTTRHDIITRHEGGGINPQYGRFDGGSLRGSLFPEKGPSTSQMIAILAGVPIGGTLLMLAGLTLMGTLLGLAVAVPLFILFSPVIVPAAMVIGLAVAGFMTSGACAVAGLAAFSWVVSYIRQTQGTLPEQLDAAKRRMADVAGQVGQKTKEVGQDIQSKAHDVKRSSS